MSKLKEQKLEKPPEMTSVAVSKKTHARLAKLFKYGDSMDDIINKCIDSYLMMMKEQRE